MKEFKDLIDINIESTKSVDELIDELLLDDNIRDFIISNDLTHDEVVNGINTFLDFKNDNFINDEGLTESHSFPGYKLSLKYSEGRVKTMYERITPLKKTFDKVKGMNLPMNIKNMSFNDFRVTTDERKKAYYYARQFINNFKTKDQSKGLYLSGSFRTGKTFLASAIANEIAEMGYNVIEVYYPELSSKLKGSINIEGDQSFLNIVETLKKCDLLILDDFGGEAINQFIRDEALGVIINYRMENNAPIIYTSNVATCNLGPYLMKDNSKVELSKALRITERIKETTEEFYISEKFIENEEDLF